MTSIIRADQISTVAGTGTVTLEAGNTLDASAGLVTPAGHVIQVEQTVKTDAFVTTTANTFVDPSFYVDITPTSAGSKILVTVNLNLANNPSTNNGGYKLQQVIGAVTTDITGYDPGGSGVAGTGGIFTNNADVAVSAAMTYLASPNTTSSVRFKILLYPGTGGTATLSMNRPHNDPSGAIYRQTSMSTITATEIAG